MFKEDTLYKICSIVPGRKKYLIHVTYYYKYCFLIFHVSIRNVSEVGNK